jgi:hypothetical protein
MHTLWHSAVCCIIQYCAGLQAGVNDTLKRCGVNAAVLNSNALSSAAIALLRTWCIASAMSKTVAADNGLTYQNVTYTAVSLRVTA